VAPSDPPPPPPPSGPLDEEDADARADDDEPREPDGAGAPPDDADALLPEADDAPPAPGEDGGPPVTRELTNAFLATKAALDRIREVVEARVPVGTPAADVDDLVQDALERALKTKSLASSVPRMRPWIARIAQNKVIDHCRANKKHLTWLRRDVDVQELPPDPATEGEDEVRPLEAVPPSAPSEPAPRGMLEAWIEGQPLTAADKLTLEMIRDHARLGGKSSDLAARFGMTTAAWDNRLLRFKAKWVPRWKKHRRNRALAIVLLLFAAAAVAVLLVLWWLGRLGPGVGPVPANEARPAPSASTDAAPPPLEDERRNIAHPPPGSQGGGPRP